MDKVKAPSCYAESLGKKNTENAYAAFTAGTGVPFS